MKTFIHRKEKSMTDSFSSFSQFDKIEAEEAFSRWQSAKQETVDEYILRRRKAELYALVRKVIRNELDSLQQEIVRLHWYEGKSAKEIGIILGMDTSSVFRRIKKINDIVYDKLKYAMEYRYGKSFCEDAKPLIKTESVACCPVEGKSIAERLRNLRVRKGLSVESVCKAVQISPSRLTSIEETGSHATARELAKLSEIYSASADYILFGNK